MRIGVPKEIKNHEYRVGLTPASVREAVAHGHEAFVERAAGTAIGLTDEQYRAAGATLLDTADEVFARAELIVKVKEPQPEECRRLRPDQVLFTYLHLAPDRPQTEALLAAGVTAIAYETVTDAHGGLPLLAPMSEVAGRMAVQAGAAHLEKSKGGAGVLLGGVPGVAPGKVAILGGGVVGYNAALIAVGLGAEVTAVDRSLDRLRWLDSQFGNRIRTLYANRANIEASAFDADLVIGAVLVPGAATPHLLGRQDLAQLRPGSVLVDVAIDQGGCFATSQPTTHTDPTYVVDGIVHYCVANMPGAVARTSTFALNNATLPFVLALAGKGWRQALQDDPQLRNGLNTHAGQLTCQAVATALGLAWTDPAQLIGLP
ncbi:alanine dehydrogenase [Dechloromonas denitrificans]|uniref:Alanine dehydrogenase n=1 Tax=Dechloromonas denitrificans TaxID=281362 RepID=A0A133XLH2_9RHOO|nr:alanine dehydrogenase [Dechloromonas denitrificans]KXB31777.1 alanine dehydrogenase [Dechloromonas denitrificans]